MRQKERGDIVLILTIGTLVVLGVSSLVSVILPKTNQSLKTRASILCPDPSWSCADECVFDQKTKDMFAGIYGDAGAALGWRQEKARNCGLTESQCIMTSKCEPLNKPEIPPSTVGVTCDADVWSCGGECASQATRNMFADALIWRQEKAKDCGFTSMDECITRNDCPAGKTVSPATVPPGTTKEPSSCGQNKGAYNITGVCDIACCVTNTDCPTGQVCGVNNEYCKSSTSCAGIPPGVTDNKPRYIRTCLGASCAWTWCDGKNYSNDHCVTDQAYPKTPSEDSLWCNQESQCETFKQPDYGSVTKCKQNNQTYDCGPNTTYTECCSVNGKARVVHRGCTQSNDSGCVYWCEGPDKNKKYKCDDVAACVKDNASCKGGANDLSVPTNGQKDGNCFNVKVTTFADKEGNGYRFNSHLILHTTSPGVGKGHMWFTYDNAIEKPDVCCWPGKDDYDLGMQNLTIEGPLLTTGAKKVEYSIRIPACGERSQTQSISCLYSIVNGKPKVEGPGCECAPQTPCTTETAATPPNPSAKACISSKGETVPRDGAYHCVPKVGPNILAYCDPGIDKASEKDCNNPNEICKTGAGKNGVDKCVEKTAADVVRNAISGVINGLTNTKDYDVSILGKGPLDKDFKKITDVTGTAWTWTESVAGSLYSLKAVVTDKSGKEISTSPVVTATAPNTSVQLVVDLKNPIKTDEPTYCTGFEPDGKGGWRSTGKTDFSCGNTPGSEKSDTCTKAIVVNSNSGETKNVEGHVYYKIECGSAPDFSCKYKYKSLNDLATPNYSLTDWNIGCIAVNEADSARTKTIKVKVTLKNCEKRNGVIQHIGYQTNELVAGEGEKNQTGIPGNNNKYQEKDFKITYQVLPYRDIGIYVFANYLVDGIIYGVTDAEGGGNGWKSFPSTEQGGAELPFNLIYECTK